MESTGIHTHINQRNLKGPGPISDVMGFFILHFSFLQGLPNSPYFDPYFPNLALYKLFAVLDHMTSHGHDLFSNKLN